MRIHGIVDAVPLPKTTCVQCLRLMEVFALLDGLTSVYDGPRNTHVSLLALGVLAVFDGCSMEPLIGT